MSDEGEGPSNWDRDTRRLVDTSEGDGVFEGLGKEKRRGIGRPGKEFIPVVTRRTLQPGWGCSDSQDGAKMGNRMEAMAEGEKPSAAETQGTKETLLPLPMGSI